MLTVGSQGLIPSAEPSTTWGDASDASENRRSFMPEYVEAMARPTGKRHLEAETREELREKLASYRWPKDW